MRLAFTPHYTVRKDGRIWSLRTKRFIKARTNWAGYKIVTLNIDAYKSHTLGVHRAVALAYLPNPDNLSDVHHIDGNRKNNHVSNLMWVSHADNMRLRKPVEK